MKKFVRTSLGILAVLILPILALAVYSAASILTFSVEMSNTGRIMAVGIGIYCDQQCTRSATSIDWGNLSPGQNATYQVYCLNTQTVNVILSMNVTGWSSQQAQTYIACGWSYLGQTIMPEQVLPVTFTLQVNSQVIGVASFGFTYIITAMQN